MFQYAVKEIGKRKKRYVLNIMVVCLVVALLITLNSLGLAYKDASRLPFEDIQNSIIIQKNGDVPEDISGTVLSCSLAPIQIDYISKINQIDGVKHTSYGLSLWVFDEDNFKRVLGVNWDDRLGEKIKSRIVAGMVPETGEEALVEKTYARQYGLDVGDRVRISGVDFTISGVIETAGNDIVSSDLNIGLTSAQSLAYNSKNLQETQRFNEDDINIIFVDADQTRVKDVKERLNVIFNSDSESPNAKTPTGQLIGTYTIYTPESFENQISGLFSLSDRLILAVSLVTLVGAILIIIKGTSHTILERRKEFGIMKAVGFRNRDIQKEIIAETFLQISIGYVAGIIISLAAVLALAQTKISITIPWELSPYPHFLLSDPTLADTVQTYLLPIKFHAEYALISFFVVFTIGLLTAIIVTRQINRLEAMEVLGYE